MFRAGICVYFRLKPCHQNRTSGLPASKVAHKNTSLRFERFEKPANEKQGWLRHVISEWPRLQATHEVEKLWQERTRVHRLTRENRKSLQWAYSEWYGVFTLSLPRVINSNFPCSLTRNMTSHSMKNLAFHSLLRWKMVVLPILTTSLIYFSFKLRRMYSLNLITHARKADSHHSPFPHCRLKDLVTSLLSCRVSESGQFVTVSRVASSHRNRYLPAAMRGPCFAFFGFLCVFSFFLRKYWFQILSTVADSRWVASRLRVATIFSQRQ